MKHFLKWVAMPFGVLAVLYCLGGTFAFYAQKAPAVEKSQLIADSTFGTPKDLQKLLNAQCEIYQDAHEITHIKSSDPLVIWGCLGRVHARDRGWQMDYFRRVAWGRTAEILGSRALISDLMLRLLNLDAIAQKVYLGLRPEMKAKFQAYAYGVNSGFLAHAAESYEFREFGYQPELWQPHHAITLLVLQSFSQTRRTFERDLLEQTWVSRYGLEAALKLLDEARAPWFTPILNAEESSQLAKTSAVAQTPAIGSPFPAAASWGKNLFGQNSGSNSWVMDAKLGAGNAPWVVNDPHVDMVHPPFWHWVNLETPEFNLLAAGLPGAPIFAAGTNGKAGWGLTNSFFDVADIFDVPSAGLAIESFRPWVWMKLGFLRVPFFFRTFERTAKEGYPILPLDEPSSPAGMVKVLRWVGYHLESRDVEAIFSIPTASDAKSMQAEFARARVASWNFVMADTRGSIAYQVTGNLPRHDRARIGIPRVEQVPAHDWLKPEEIPHAYNPAKHYLVTANQRHYPEAFSVWPGRAHYPAFRGFRIHEKIDARVREGMKFDLAENLRILCDSQNVDARFIVPLLIPVLETQTGWSSVELAHLQELKSWHVTDYRADEDCRACGIYQRWLDITMRESDLDTAAVYQALSGVPLKGWDAAFLARAYKKAVAELGAVKPWREMHLQSFSHLSGHAGFEHPPGIPTIGSEYSVSPGSGYFDGKIYRHVDGPSQRLLMEMTSPPKVYLNLAGTNLDHEKRDLTGPNSPYQLFRRCETPLMDYPLNWQAVKSTPLPLTLR